MSRGKWRGWRDGAKDVPLLLPLDAAKLPVVRAALDDLTPREREVLGVVFTGCTNEETARRLGVSPRTVEVHLGRLMKACGMVSRLELYRYVEAAERAQSARDSLTDL